MLYTVGEMAKLLNIAPSTLRYYDKEGLLPFVERSAGGIRMFRDVDYEWLKIIGCLKRSGLSLKDIRTYIQMALQGDETIKDRLELFQKQRENVKKQMADLQDTLDMVDYKCWFYETALAAGSTTFPKTIPLDQLPDQYQKTLRNLKIADNKEEQTAVISHKPADKTA